MRVCVCVCVCDRERERERERERAPKGALLCQGRSLHTNETMSHTAVQFCRSCTHWNRFSEKATFEQMITLKPKDATKITAEVL